VFDVNDQHILVTGASSGFGRHFARFRSISPDVGRLVEREVQTAA
jgi:hypothetical protein